MVSKNIQFAGKKSNLINLKPDPVFNRSMTLGRFLTPLKKCFRDGNMAQCVKMLATNSGDQSSLFRTNKRGESWMMCSDLHSGLWQVASRDKNKCNFFIYLSLLFVKCVQNFDDTIFVKKWNITLISGYPL